VVPDGILHQIGIVSSAEHVHYPVLVIGNSPGRHLQDAADLLHLLAQLRHPWKEKSVLQGAYRGNVRRGAARRDGHGSRRAWHSGTARLPFDRDFR